MNSFYVSHTGMTEPLGASQVLPYLQGLAKAGWEIDLVAFEPASASAEEIAAVRAQLHPAISYHPQPRSSSHSLAVKLAESARALQRVGELALRKRPRLVHARSYLPAAVAAMLSAIVPGARFLFDCRGLLADEYVDANHWQKDSLNYLLTKSAERALFARADGLVVLTERIRRYLIDDAALYSAAKPIEVIPCCVDLDRFRCDAAARKRTRERLQLDDAFVLVYSGSLGSWYCEEQMAAFVAAVQQRRRMIFVAITRADTAAFSQLLTRRGVDPANVRFVTATPNEMPALLAAGDAALSFITPCFSKMASSPTKVAEYLAIGLPVAMNRGVGDADALIDDETACVIDAGDMSSSALQTAADHLLATYGENVAVAARQVAQDRFSVETVGIASYRRLYERLLH